MKKLAIPALLIGALCMSSGRFPESTSIKKIEKQFKYIPSGNVLVDGDTLSVQAFKILDHEVTNKEYRAFLAEMKKKKPALVPKLMVRKNGWSERFPNGYLKPMDDLYFTNEAYDDYPVVNISQFAAREYCNWLTEKMNQDRDENEKIIVRLPLRAEFIRAGAGNNLGRTYAWGDHYMRNSEGSVLCNYTRIPQTRMSREGKEVVLKDLEKDYPITEKEKALTAKTKSYYPSEFGIYNLNGNVAEWLQEDEMAAGGSWYDLGYDVRLASVKKHAEANPEVGFRPMFTVNLKEYIPK